MKTMCRRADGAIALMSVDFEQALPFGKVCV